MFKYSNKQQLRSLGELSASAVQVGIPAVNTFLAYLQPRKRT